MRLLLFSLALFAFSCSHATGDDCKCDRDLTENTVYFHLNTQPDGLHPFFNASGNRTIIFNYTQRTLFKLDLETFERFPVLAEALPTISEDQLEYSIRIREGIKWDDGTDLTAQDVLFSAKMITCPLNSASSTKVWFSDVFDEIRIDPEDPYAFTMKARSVDASNVGIFDGLYIQQKSRWDPSKISDSYDFADYLEPGFEEFASASFTDWFNEFQSEDNSFVPENLVGLGPYRITVWEVDRKIELIKKENWWASDSGNPYDAAYPDRILFRIIKDSEEVVKAIKAQEIDVSTRIGTSDLLKLQKDKCFRKNYEADFVPEFAYTYIGLNARPKGNRVPLFTDPRVRKALSYATPYDEIIETSVQGHGYRQVSNVSRLKEAYNDDLRLIPHDLKAARSLLTEAGWIDLDNNGVREKMIDDTLREFRFSLNYFGTSQLSKEMAELIRDTYLEVGVIVEPSPLDFTILYKLAYENDFDATFGVWGGSGAYSDPKQLWHTGSWGEGSNFTGFGDAESDSLIALCNGAVDKDSRNWYLKQLQEKIYRESNYIFLYSRTRPTIIHKRFKNRQMFSEKPGLLTNNLLLSQR